jgi:hypothetical protein
MFCTEENRSLPKEENKFGQFLLAHDGPFYKMQRLFP